MKNKEEVTEIIERIFRKALEDIDVVESLNHWIVFEEIKVIRKENGHSN